MSLGSLRVLHVASEVAPWAQTGGLADVVAALPRAQAAADPAGQVAVLAPLYRAAAAALDQAGVTPVVVGPDRTLVVGQHVVRARLLRTDHDGLAIGWLDAPALYDRDGLYGAPGGADHPDNHVRFAALGLAAVRHGAELLGGKLDLVHAHDWQAGLAPLLLRLDPARASVAVVTTIHNLAFRGLFPRAVVPELGLPWSVFDHHHAEFWDQLSFLKAGLAYADVVTTVSPSYAREIQEPIAGHGLDGFLRWDVPRVVGIVNGIDDGSWDPATDPALAASFRVERPQGKARCRHALAAELGLTVDDHTVLAAVVARMSEQKGLDLVADVVPDLHGLGIKLVVLGAGEPALEGRFRYLAEVFRQHLAVRIGFEPALARRIYAGADLFVMPSRFEPCGLGQLYAMRYGAVPVVRAVGGLRDTVIDTSVDLGHDRSADASADASADDGTGFVFDAPTAAALRAALGRATRVFRTAPAAWAALRRRAMARDSSWTASAREYLQVYRAAVRHRRGA